MADAFIQKHQQAYNSLEAKAKRTKQSEDLIEIRLEQLRECISIIKHCDTMNTATKQKKDNPYAKGYNHWRNMENEINEKLAALGYKSDDEGGGGGGGEDDDDDDGDDEVDDLPPVDRVFENGKWVNVKH